MPFRPSAVFRIPSITSWTRLEPLPRQASMERSLQAQVRDPLWMLTRQWQFGEFQGDDSGSPAAATMAVEERNLTGYFPGTDPSKAAPLDEALPLEAHVEREGIALELRGSAQLGSRFEKMVRGRMGAGAGAIVPAFRNAFPIAPVSPDPDYAGPGAAQFRRLASGRVTDGEGLFTSASIAQAGGVPPQPLPPEASDPGMPELLADFVAFRRSVYNEPSQDSAWQPQRLDYSFGVTSQSGGASTVLNAPEFPGGRLDWYSFSLAPSETTPPAPAQPGANQASTTSYNFLPNHVTFRGMPDPRWWNFEDAVTDFGQLDTEHVDLAKMLVMEFALTYGNDWFWIPVPAAIGSLTRVTTLVVTDTFGERTLIRPSEQTQVNPGETPWSMFKISGPGVRSDSLLMTPALGVVDEGEAIEDVVFLRDDMAAMGWAVENTLPGELDTGIDGYEIYQERLRRDPPPPPPAVVPGGPQIKYTLETAPPDNWIPLVPVLTPTGEPYLRRGTMVLPTSTGFTQLRARAVVLEPGKPYFLPGRVVTRAGVEVSRYFRRTRWMGGSTFVWLARRSLAGRGPEWSGLRFDIVEKLRGAA